jgi:hypothetical protein
MERASDHVVAALAGLHGHQDWAVVQKWLQASRDSDIAALALSKDEVTARWLQGSVQTLTAILDVSGRALEIVHNRRVKTQ